MESDADRLAMIKSLGGQLIRHIGGEFWAIFDNDFIVSGDVESRVPALTARTIDAVSMTRESVVELGSASYRVKSVQPDGTGMTILILKR